MTTPIRDLWPNDIAVEEVVSPEEILKYQANLLAEKTNGRLVGRIGQLSTKDRVVLAFEIEAPQAGNRIRLFEVEHRHEFPYPARISPPEELPEFLKDRVYRPGTFEGITDIGMTGRWIQRKGIASSPTEFSNKIAELLDSASAKSLILSLLSRANPTQGPDDSSARSS